MVSEVQLRDNFSTAQVSIKTLFGGNNPSLREASQTRLASTGERDVARQLWLACG